MHLSPPPPPPVAYADVRSKAVVLLLLTCCLLLLPLWESVIVLCFVVRYFMSLLVLQSSWWGRESWLLCLVCLPGVSYCCVVLPRGAKGLSAACDCGISWSYSLTIFVAMVAVLLNFVMFFMFLGSHLRIWLKFSYPIYNVASNNNRW